MSEEWGKKWISANVKERGGGSVANEVSEGAKWMGKKVECQKKGRRQGEAGNVRASGVNEMTRKYYNEKEEGFNNLHG